MATKATKEEILSTFKSEEGAWFAYREGVQTGMNNKVPEKIYLNPIQNALTELLSTKVKGDIEYTRKDAFIEKACNTYCKVCGHYPHTVPTHICRKNCDYFSDFKKYMED